MNSSEDWQSVWESLKQASPNDALQGGRRLRAAGWSPNEAAERFRFSALQTTAQQFHPARKPTPELLCKRVSDVVRIHVDGALQYAIALDGEDRALVCSWPEALVVREIVTGEESCWHLLDAESLASSGTDAAITFWDLPSGTPYKRLLGHNQLVTCLERCSDGTWISAGVGGEVIIWDWKAGVPRCRFMPHESPVLALAPDPAAAWVLSWHWDGVAVVWSLADGSRIGELHEAADLHYLELSPDGRTAIGSRMWNERAKIVLYDLPAGHIRRSWFEEEDGLTRQAVSPTGRSFILSNITVENRVYVYSLPEGDHKAILDAEGVYFAFSPSGRFWVDRDYPQIKVWDGLSYTLLVTLPLSNSNTPLSIAFSPDERLLLLGAYKQPLEILEFAATAD